MQQNDSTAAVPTTELSRAIAALEQRHFEREERLRWLRLNLSWSMALLFAVGICFAFHLPHLYRQNVLLVCITNGLPIICLFGYRLARRPDRKEAELARVVAKFDDPAIVWALLPILESLYGPTYPIVSDALIRILGRCDEWHSGEWSDKQRLILQNAAKWLADGDTLPDPDLTAAVERALTPALGAARPTLVRSVSRVIPRWRRPS